MRSDVVSSGELERFREIVGRRVGLVLDVGKDALLTRALIECAHASHSSSITEYLDGALSARGELDRLARLLTISETYFFRDPKQFEALRAHLLVLRKQGRKEVRLLSAGCASGEEAFSMAICAREVFHGTNAKIQIDAIDLNPDVLQRARRAAYRNWSLRAVPLEIREKYFSSSGGENVLDPSVAAMVDFRQENLVEPVLAFWAPQRYDVVFCRNVLMYFAKDVTAQVVSRLENVLRDEGILFLGHAENLRGLSDVLDVRQSHGAFYYHKSIAGRSDGPGGALYKQAALDPLFDSSLTASNHVRGLSQQHASAAKEESRGEEKNAALGPRDDERGLPQALESALDFAKVEKFRDALDVLQGSEPSSESWRFEYDSVIACLLTSLSRYQDANLHCHRLLEESPQDPLAHYLLSLCHERFGNWKTAQMYAEVAADGDQVFAFPCVQLARLAKRRGDDVGARRAFCRALERIDHEQSRRILLLGGGLDRLALKKVYAAEVQTSKGRG